MNPTERSAKLRTEADELLRNIKLAELCSAIGTLIPTGSYYLDLMVYPDIDLYLPPATPRQLFQMVTHLVEHHPVERVNFLNGGPGPLKNGLYIKPVIAFGDWERPWKIDIWAVDQSFIAEKNAELRSIKERMTPEQRELIVNYKYSILTPAYRTPMFSGVYIYRAVIDYGMVDHKEITEYLREHAIEI
jgi:hypothetical protein